MSFEVENMDTHFNQCASDYDRHFYEDLGMKEFYDEIEKQIALCGNPQRILVLGCGTGLEIERIQHSATVTAIDISPDMLAELHKKKLHSQIVLNVICGSYFDISFDSQQYDLVLSTYSLHHFTTEQKSKLYGRIFHCLHANGVFINGDSVCPDVETETMLMDRARETYREQGQSFGSIHIDVPLALETECELLNKAGFSAVSVERRWFKSALMKAKK